LDVPFWSQYISFILVGILIATSIRGFLKKFLTLFHTYSSSVSVTSSYMALILGQVMGIYFVSNIYKINNRKIYFLIFFREVGEAS